MKALAICLVLFSVALPSVADDWLSPEPKELKSPNGLYSLRIQLGSSKGEAIFLGSNNKEKYAKAISIDPEGRTRTFQLINPISPVDAVLLDDGTLVTFDNWHHMGYSAAIACYSAQGSLKWSHSLEDLFSKQVLERIPRTISSRWWRKNELEWRTEVDESGEVFGFITLWNEDKLKVHLSDGAVNYVEVQELRQDPDRLLLRGRDLAERKDYSGAIEVLSRAISLQPDLIPAYQALAGVYENQGNYDAAVKVLRGGISQNPATDAKLSGGSFQADPKMWLLLDLARAFRAGGSLKDAEGVFLECLRLDPGFWAAGHDFAYLLIDSSRQAEADRLLADFFEILRGDPDSFMANRSLIQAAQEIGEIYSSHKQYEKARQYYLRAYGKGEYDESLASALASTLEKLGEAKEALVVLQELKTWLTGRKYYESSLALVEKNLQRVSEILNSQAQSQEKTDAAAEVPAKPPS
jgi:tetratricopeptide (TPR) repeat protein